MNKTEYSRQWRLNNPEKSRAIMRRARLKQARNCKAKVEEIKMASGCVDCGYNEHPEALEFDHVRGEKLFNVASGIRKAWSKVLEEIAKCEVVCANCHRIRTANRREHE